MIRKLQNKMNISTTSEDSLWIKKTITWEKLWGWRSMSSTIFLLHLPLCFQRVCKTNWTRRCCRKSLHQIKQRGINWIFFVLIDKLSSQSWEILSQKLPFINNLKGSIKRSLSRSVGPYNFLLETAMTSITSAQRIAPCNAILDIFKKKLGVA